MLSAMLYAIWAGIRAFSILIAPYRVILLQLAIAFIFELTGLIINLCHINNVVLFNVYMLGDVLLVGFAGILLNERRSIKVFFTCILFSCALIWVWIFLKSELKQFFNWSFVMNCICLCLIYLTALLNNVMKSRYSIVIPGNSEFWVCFAIIIYYGCCIPFFGFMNYLLNHHPKIVQNIYTINVSLAIIRYSIIGLTFNVMSPFKLLKQNKIDR